MGNLFVAWRQRASLFMLAALCLPSVAFATNHLVRINEILAGVQGDPDAQYVEIVAGIGQKSWGPNGGPAGRAELAFFDGNDVELGRFVFPSNAPSGNDTVLVATQAFQDTTGIVADFTIAPLMSPGAGKVCFRDNAGSQGAFFVNLCLSYGGAAFTGDTEGAGSANNASLPTVGFTSLARNSDFFAAANNNADFDLATPTPASTQTPGDNIDLGLNLQGELIDSDNDGVPDDIDAFPDDPSESEDTDEDGIGNNADLDDDGDAVDDDIDNCPLVPNAAQTDSDGDGFGNLCDSDRDGDGVQNDFDAFPDDPFESADNDGDLVGDNADLDDDNDGVPDVDDAFPFDDSESLDSDNDSLGNNADPDDDNDGVADGDDAFPLDPSESSDLDGDGIGDVADLDDDGDDVPDLEDNCPITANAGQTDTDGDGLGDACDSDIDGDGVANENDAFPLDATETADNDADGIGDVADPDDDNDGVADLIDNCPLAPNPDQANGDGDGLGDACDFAASLDLLLPTNAVDFVVDEERGVIYVSLASSDEVVIVSVAAGEIVGSIPVGDNPQGIDLSIDSQTLYVALRGEGAVAVVDLDTLGLTKINVEAGLTNSLTHDVAEVRAGRLVVTANPSSSGLARVALVKTDDNNVVSSIGSGRFIRAQPTIAVDRARSVVYVGEQFSPNSLYKLDLTSDNGAIVLEDSHGTVGGTNHLALNPAGTHILTRAGQLLRTESFTTASLLPTGPSVFRGDGERVYVASSGTEIEVFDRRGLVSFGTFSTECALATTTHIEITSDDEQLVLLGGDRLCVVPIPDETPAPDPGNNLGGAPHDMVVDESGGVLYVSVPARNEIVVLSLSDLTVLKRIVVGSRPHGIDLSIDRSALWVALGGGGAVARLNLNSHQVDEVVIAPALSTSAVFDVAEVTDGHVVATGNAGLARVVLINATLGNQVTTVANNRFIRAAPTIVADRANKFAYVREGFSPNSLYKLDFSTSAGTLVAEDAHGSLANTDGFDVSVSGDHIALRSGQILDASTLVPSDTVPAGLPAFHPAGDLLLVASSASLNLIDGTFSTVGQRSLACQPGTQHRVEVTTAGVFFALESSSVCREVVGLDGVVDTDGDGVVNANDVDDDGDGIADLVDNCVLVPNEDQADLDADGIGDVCDDDRDADGLLNALDNCPDLANESQADADSDGAGDACDANVLNVRINEILAGTNGDSSVQFVELVADSADDKNWGPGTGAAGVAMLTFFDATGVRTGRYVFPSDPPPGADTVLIATAKFAETMGLQPDFVMPRLVVPVAGEVCFTGNPDASAPATVAECVAYGGSEFTGSTQSGENPGATTLPIMDTVSLSRVQFDPAFPTNLGFILRVPTPSSSSGSTSILAELNIGAGQVTLPGPSSLSAQGETLFFEETFLGNGRTCGSCHLASENFGLFPSTVATLPASDPLFVHESNVNTIVVDASRTGNPTGNGSQPSDFQLHSVVSGSAGGSAVVIGGSGGIYEVIGGQSLDIPGNVLTDANGNQGSLLSFVPGNLNGPPPNGDTRGLEDSVLLRGGRALIVENINGLDETAVMRGSPTLLNIQHTGPFGLSGEFGDLESFSAGAVAQHFPKNLARRTWRDFREATPRELSGMRAFMDTILLVADDLDNFATTAAQKRGRALFFGDAKCSVCHGGDFLATSDGRFGTSAGVNEAFNTGVVNLPVNQTDGLPPENDLGQPANSREFSTPGLLGVRDTAPFFHDHSVATLREAIEFYSSAAFATSPASAQIGGIAAASFPANVDDLEAFMLALVEPPFSFTRSLAFGVVDVESEGGFADVEVVAGDATLTIVSTSITGPGSADFSVGPALPNSGPFGASTSRSLNVAFAPSVAGLREAILEIEVSDGEQTFDVGVALSGVGQFDAIDTDEDGVPDDLDADDDGDGVADEDELLIGTNPLVPDVRFVLGPGDHFISFPVLPSGVFTSADIINVFGAEKVVGIDGGQITTTQIDGGSVVNAFDLSPGAGFHISLPASVDVTLTGEVGQGLLGLPVGVSWIGFSAANPPPGGAFDVLSLAQLGGRMASISRLNPHTRRFETALIKGGVPVGVNFAVVFGEGYIVSMTEPAELGSGPEF